MNHEWYLTFIFKVHIVTDRLFPWPWRYHQLDTHSCRHTTRHCLQLSRRSLTLHETTTIDTNHEVTVMVSENIPSP